jgi:DNA-binding IclR family transcriptional regulator
MMLRDLAAEAQITPAQAHAYLVSYRRAALVEREAASGMYALGPFALRLGLARMRSVDSLEGAGRAAAEVSKELGLMVALVVWGPRAPTAVQVYEGAQTLNVNVRAGTIFSVVGSASGQVFAAFSDHEAVRARIRLELDGEARDLGQNPRISRRQLEADLRRVRRLGLAEVSGAPTPGISSLAAPVFSADDAVELALTLIGTTETLGQDIRNTAAQRLTQTCRTLSKPPERRSE